MRIIIIANENYCSPQSCYYHTTFQAGAPKSIAPITAKVYNQELFQVTNIKLTLLPYIL